MSNDTRAAALEILRVLVGRDDADFHEGQFEAIEALVDDGSRALVVQRTGWGKSAVYFVATLLLRQRGSGPTVLVSPLLALMRDQIIAAERAGVRAVAINSTNAHEWADVLARLRDDDVDVLLLSPERLNNPAFRDEQLPALVERMGMLVVDEAHCISDWGHDFRPDYRRLGELIRRLPAGVPILATTATANSRVVTDVAEQLAGGSVDVVTIRGPLARASLRLGVLRLPDARARLAWLLTHLGDLPGSGIIYSLTVSGAQDVARLLREAGHDVRAYTGQTDAAEREESEALLKTNRVKALVATSALGMGFDKPDLGFVVHIGAPSSPVAYYQQVGRAGRATENADVLLLPGVEDPDIWRYFATASMPTQERAERVIAELGDRPISTPALEALVDIRRTPLELLLKVLDVDGAVHRVRGGWVSTGQPWTYDAERYERIAAARQVEQQYMLDYETTTRLPHGVPAAHPRRRHRRTVRTLRQLRGRLVPDRRRRARGGVRRRVARARRGADRAAGAVADRSRSSRHPVQGQHPARRARRRGSRAGTTHRPRLGRRAAHAVRRRAPRMRPITDALRDAAIRVLADWPWARAPGIRRRAAVASPPAAGRLVRAQHRRSRSTAVSRKPSDPQRRPHRRAGWQQRLPALRTVGSIRRVRRWSSPTDPCCSSTTWPTAGGRSPSRRASFVAPARRRCCPSRWRFGRRRPQTCGIVAVSITKR